ncbi:sodium-dependent transporter [Palaeococcus ferrophilus]|uniref:sodium-dependent transporter n=1 Tax=Palaeococcus ferrophilus TaxID=83868 RepID=UPI00064E21FE|nr:sodium-dependent transporter [Palaeococcus ferrophilus]
MDTRKWTAYLILLVAGYAAGIGTLGLVPQFWLKYGTNGLGAYILFTVAFMYLAITEAEAVQRSRYHFVELYTKLTPYRGMLIAAFVLNVLFLSYYTANVGLTLLSPFLGTGTMGRLIAKILIIVLAYLIISRAKEKTFLIMAWGGITFILLVVLLGILFRTTISPDNAYLQMANGMLHASHPITLALLRDAAIRAIYGVGLGFMFYLMLGSFLGDRFNAKVIIGGGVLIQVLVGIMGTYTLIYGASQASPGLLLNFATGGEEAALKFMGELVTYLTPLQTLLIGLGLFMAGITSIIPIFETALQMVPALMGVGRKQGANYVAGIVLILGLVNAVPLVADISLQAVNIALFITAIFEAIPLVYRLKHVTLPERAIAAIGIVMFAVLGIETLHNVTTMGTQYWASVIIALAVLVIGVGVRSPPGE